MSSHADSTVTIQTSVESVLSPPSWFGEVVLLARYLKQQGVLEGMNERMRFAWRRFGPTRPSIFSRSSSAMPSVANAPWKLSTKDSSPLQFLIAPYGLADLFNMVLRRNPCRVTREQFAQLLRSKQILREWPRVQAIYDE